MSLFVIFRDLLDSLVCDTLEDNFQRFTGRSTWQQRATTRFCARAWLSSFNRDIHDQRVLAAMNRVPRHLFVPEENRHLAYQDGPLPIGENQTISQPYIVALMSQLLQLTGPERVLEVGTGCGYQTAVLCELARYVYSLERYPRLAEHAATTLNDLGYENVDVHVGDGVRVWSIWRRSRRLSSAARHLCPALCSQLHPAGGRW
jgi:protein-L-isoaspartate(D-aspartate) O-methyltransferase